MLLEIAIRKSAIKDIETLYVSVKSQYEEKEKVRRSLAMVLAAPLTTADAYTETSAFGKPTGRSSPPTIAH
jgi:hypothetical protein